MIGIQKYLRSVLSKFLSIVLPILLSMTATVLLGVIPVHAAQLVSQWKAKNIVIDGVNRKEWNPSSTALILQRGWIQAQNDNQFLYLFINLGGDTFQDRPKNKKPWGDFIRISVDVNRDGKITPKVDVAYALFPGTYSAGKQYYLGAGRSTGLNQTKSRFATGFSRSLTIPVAHRMWEVVIPLKEIRAKAGGHIRFDLQTHSEKPKFYVSSPANHQRDFSRLYEIQLATRSLAFKPGHVLKPPITASSQGDCKANNSDTKPTPVSSTITAAGHVITRYSNGKTIEKYPGGKKVTQPNGQVQLFSYSTQAPAAIPPSLPDQAETNWLAGHNAALLNIIKTMVNYNAEAIQHYQEYENAGSNLYQQIEKRANTINYLSSP